MEEAMRHHSQPPDNERRFMSQETAAQIMAGFQEEVVPFIDAKGLNKLAQRMGDSTRFDGWELTQRLTTCLGSAYDLYWTDLDLRRPCLGNEHAAAVFDGNEIDYVEHYYDNPDIVKIARWTALLQDVAKPISVAETGDNFSQTRYNVLATRKIVDAISNEHLNVGAKRAVVLLVGLGVVGEMLQGFDIAEQWAAFQAAWPAEYAEYRDDLVLSSYLSDASAHSAFRLYNNARSGFYEPAVRPDDDQLTFLFERHRSGAVTLTPDRCVRMLEQFPGIRGLRYLCTGELGPYAREDDVFAEVLRRKLGRVAGVRDPHEYGEDVFTVETSARYGAHVVVNSYLNDSYSTSQEHLYWSPGDGRMWGRSVWVNVSGLVPYDGPPSPGYYQHADPEVAAMQYRVEAARYTQSEEIGRPLSVSRAWHIINRVENLL